MLRDFLKGSVRAVLGERGMGRLREMRMLRDARRCLPSTDPLVERTIELWVRPGMVVVDAGAHQGLWTFRLARAVGRGGHVFAFEPSPEYASSLRKVIDQAGLTNVTMLPIALGDHDGTTGFRTHDESGQRLTGESRLAAAREAGDAEVEIARLDSLVARFPRLAETDVIKVDVEGAELKLFLGADALLRHRKPRIYAEIEDRHCLRFGWARKDVLDHLGGLGYVATPVNPWDFRIEPG